MKEEIMTVHVIRRHGRDGSTPLARAALVLLGLALLGYFAIATDENSERIHGGFSAHAAASQISRTNPPIASDAGPNAPASLSAQSRWDVDPQVNPTAKMAEALATF
jgi:hypothetical protein